MFTAVVERLPQRAFVGLAVEFIQREAAHAFVDEVRDLDVKRHRLMRGDRSLNETLNQALEPEATKVAARRPARSDDSPEENSAATSRTPQ